MAWQDEQSETPYDINANGVQRNGHTFLFDPLTVGQAPGSQTERAVAANGGTVLVSWTDERSAPDGGVYLRAIDWGGVDPFEEPLPSSPGTRVTTVAGTQSQAAVARRGDGFVVAWTDTRSGNSDIFAARVGRLGRVLDKPGVAIAAGPRNESTSAISAGDGTQLVAYERDVRAAPYDGRGRVFVRVLR